MNLRNFRAIHNILSALFIDNSETDDLQLILVRSLKLRNGCGKSWALRSGYVIRICLPEQQIVRNPG